MREILLKNLITDDKRRHEIFVSERSEGKDIVQELEKKSVYVIKQVLEITPDFDGGLFLSQKRREGLFKPAKTFIIKIHDTKEMKDKFIYKVLGDQYVVLEDKIFLLGVTQYLKIETVHN